MPWTAATMAYLHDGSLWRYEYNKRSELVSGKRFWNDFSPVAGQHYAFTYDNAGNRGQALSGGDVNGGNSRQTSYTPSALNQYSAASNPSYAQVIGAATAPATVTINGGAADRKGEYYRGEVSAANGSGPAVLAISAVASLSGTSVTNSGSLIIPGASQSFAYDANGSLTNDGVWHYVWDAENRLKEITNTTAVASAYRKKRKRHAEHLS